MPKPMKVENTRLRPTDQALMDSFEKIFAIYELFSTDIPCGCIRPLTLPDPYTIFYPAPSYSASTKSLVISAISR